MQSYYHVLRVCGSYIIIDVFVVEFFYYYVCFKGFQNNSDWEVRQKEHFVRDELVGKIIGRLNINNNSCYKLTK